MTLLYSGGGTNSDLHRSISGQPSSVEVTKLFGNVTATDIKLGKTDYILVYWKQNIRRTFQELIYPSIPSNSIITVGLDPTGFSYTPDITGIEYNHKKPKNIKFVNLTDPFPLPIRQNISQHGYIPIWFKRSLIDGTDITESIDIEIDTIEGFKSMADSSDDYFFLNISTSFTFQELNINPIIGTGIIGQTKVE